MAEWIKEAENLPKIARESNLFAKKVTAKEIFGSNLVLAGREARVSAPKSIAFPPQNQWTALCAANEKVGQFSESQILVRTAGIGPASTAWKAVVLPLYYVRYTYHTTGKVAARASSSSHILLEHLV